MTINPFSWNGGYTTQPRVKVVRHIVTRTFDENESLIEEREETETEYKYVSTPYATTYPVTYTAHTNGTIK